MTAALLAAGVALLVDVRAVPSSRKPGFSKHILAASLKAAGIGYVHLRPLGTPKPGRDAVRRGDVAAMERIYAAHMQGDEPRAALAEATALGAGQTCCLLCFEHDHRTCHRRLVAEMVTAQTGQTVRHLAPAI